MFNEKFATHARYHVTYGRLEGSEINIFFGISDQLTMLWRLLTMTPILSISSFFSILRLGFF